MIKTGGLAVVFYWCFCAVLAYIESSAANAQDRPDNREHEEFIPQVAFKCGFRNQYLQKNGMWTTDTNRYATCLRGKLEILKYCRKAYPDLDITNIVEDSHVHKIADWCKESGKPCKWTHTVRPYRCVVGSFQSEALLVPQGCRFGHVDDRQVCEKFEHWHNVTQEQCDKRNGGMSVRSFALLAPCGLDMFSGVEFVCCGKGTGEPTADDVKMDVHVKATVAKDESKEDSRSSSSEEDDYDDEDDDDDDEDYDDDDDSDEDYEDDDDEDTDENSESSEETDTGDDPYFRVADPDNEHDNYKAALARLEKEHRRKVTKVMREWSELENRYKGMKSRDPKHAEEFRKEMTARFQKTVAALEDEQREARRQLDDVHTQRVQAMLNERKRQTVKEYRDALAVSVGTPQPHRVLRTLQAYIRAEEKDRVHSLNHYRHLLKVDEDRAAEQRSGVLRRLKDIDFRIEATIAMLHDIKVLENKIKPTIMQFWRTFRKENTPGIEEKNHDLLSGPDSNRKLVEFYEEQVRKDRRDHQPVRQESRIETEELDDWKEQLKEDRLEPQLVQHFDEPHQSQAQKSNLGHSHLMHEAKVLGSGNHSLLVFTIACVALLVAVVFGVFTVKRRRNNKGFEKVNTNSPEEQHVSGMQVNGYENPTYHYFEKA